jgi:hypothetical protein
VVDWTVGLGRQKASLISAINTDQGLSTTNLLQRFLMPDPKSTPTKEELGHQLTRLVTDQIRPTFESIFIHLHEVYDGADVCQMALVHQDADKDTAVSNVLRFSVLDTLNKQLIFLSMLISGMGGTTDYHEGTDYDDKDKSKEDDDEA